MLGSGLLLPYAQPIKPVFASQLPSIVLCLCELPHKARADPMRFALLLFLAPCKGFSGAGFTHQCLKSSPVALPWPRTGLVCVGTGQGNPPQFQRYCSGSNFSEETLLGRLDD